jgi:hypothetical protein
MPKPKHSIDDKYLNQLRQDLQATIGMVVRNRPDTERFSQLVRKTKDVYISPSTFSRLFLTAGAANHFYLDTLDKLASLTYPYSSWEEYCRVCESSQEQLKQIGMFQPKNPKVNLLGLNIATSTWKPLHLLFEEMSSDRSFIASYRFMYDFGQSFFDILTRTPQSELDFYKRFLKYPIIRKSFFELNADPDFVLPNYVKGLDYYIKSIDINDAVAKNDLLFSLCLQYYYYLNNADFTQMQSKYNQIISMQDFDALSANEVHPFNSGRYLSVRIYNAYHFDAKKVESAVIDALQWVNNQLTGLNDYDIRVISYHLLEAFMKCSVNQLYIDKLMSIMKVEDELISDSSLLKQTIFNIEPSGIRWTRRFKSQAI